MVYTLSYQHLRRAPTREAGVQAAFPHSVASAQPSQEPLQTQTVATVGGGTVPIDDVNSCAVRVG
jgi:hypothetical protein